MEMNTSHQDFLNPLTNKLSIFNNGVLPDFRYISSQVGPFPTELRIQLEQLEQPTQNATTRVNFLNSLNPFQMNYLNHFLVYYYYFLYSSYVNSLKGSTVIKNTSPLVQFSPIEQMPGNINDNTNPIKEEDRSYMKSQIEMTEFKNYSKPSLSEIGPINNSPTLQNSNKFLLNSQLTNAGINPVPQIFAFNSFINSNAHLFQTNKTGFTANEQCGNFCNFSNIMAP